MARAGGKGKISNDLVAASCAAVLAVYAAGYWRTRDAARRIEARAQERRPAQPVRAAATGTKSAVIEAAAPTAQPPSAAPATISPPMVAAAPSVAAASKASSKAAAAVAPPPIAPPQATPATEPSVAAVAVTSALEPDPASLSTPDSLAAPSGNWRDGTYTGWGTSRHGDIKVQVVIKNGRIVESSIASCETAYPCDVISMIVHQPVARQNPDVDRVSRATESADAYYFGLVEALAAALTQPADHTTTPR